ncbi:MAG: TIGR01906 family membrane protein [SAR202 cluster bacterium]|jgi:integral membrane protein (TIGR01906 family)|nr:TIGR01906 family membrane protein [SAR202 cluster bacterium]MDP6800389.1 TIGR01906 family membrane protein [SAR202 cluster bacterium]MQG56672.1 TIGR01906 family membrane protein [SAR202 cluster bacterium]MQG69140.1 TIGR01906 family membrane protein [SAR202 cluster bacterium]HAL49007.1 TIGR01906 family membrane protein [Dehalococcoidia bacterium]|tara:strand:- start:5816 stop:6574 length:759 start_codon:yes stop_codon:yes gene_type:complete
MLDAKRITGGLKILAVAAFVAFVPVFLITFNVRWVVNFPPLYTHGYDGYENQIKYYLDIERDDYLEAGRQIREYFNDDSEFIVIEVPVGGVTVVNLFNEREILHMVDVKVLIHLVYRLSEITGAYLLGFAVAGFALRKREFLALLGRFASMGGILTLALGAFVGLGSLVGFDRLFLFFHEVSFSNDLWQLDPRRDYLIAMFPQGFFFDATILIAGSVVVQAILLAAVPMLLLRRAGRAAKNRRSPQRADSRA